MSIIVKAVVFVAVSIGVTYVSRGSLRNRRSHGFFRFFGFEFILALFLLNVDYWFADPFSWHQLISWCFLVISIIPLAFGVHSLVKKGKPVQQREGESQLLAFEKTSVLVTTGIYHYVRHPLYSSLLFLTLGIAFKSLDWISGLLSMLVIVFLFATAKADEAECIRFFGSDYQTYMTRTRMFIPFIL
ncbi:MAG TPA: isoprenylcysteine carboxylmethyltransferase family protein [Anaerolineaceae bacterium]|nr:isoprenylcysteine carboxylmethyltransferase family protein [Anaerolineaceae bacterium]